MSDSKGGTQQIYAPDGVTLLKDYLDGKATQPIAELTWAQLSALNPATYPSRQVLVTDVGVGGSFWRSNGAIWRLIAPIVLAGSAVPSATLTGTLTETILTEVAIPAGVMGLNRSLRIRGDWSCNANANAKTVRARHGETQGSISGASAIISIGSAATTIAITGENLWTNVNAANVQKGSPSALSGNGGTTASAFLSGNENTANQTYIQFTGTLADVGDNIALSRYLVELLPA